MCLLNILNTGTMCTSRAKSGNWYKTVHVNTLRWVLLQPSLPLQWHEVFFHSHLFFIFFFFLFLALFPWGTFVSLVLVWSLLYTPHIVIQWLPIILFFIIYHKYIYNFCSNLFFVVIPSCTCEYGLINISHFTSLKIE